MIAALQELATESGESPASLALAWLMSKGTKPIFGATSISHVQQAVRATTLILTQDQIQRLEQPYRTLPQVDLPYSAKNQARIAALPIVGAP